MDFVVIGCIFLPFFWLSFGTFGSLAGSCVLKNTVATVGDVRVRIATLRCEDSHPTSLTLIPVGGQTEIVITSSTTKVANGFVLDKTDPVTCYYVSKKADASTAGVYSCWKDQEAPTFAQFIAVDATPTCDVLSNPDKNRVDLCKEETWELSCSLKYSANESHVVVNIVWFIGASTGSNDGKLETSTEANIITLTSKWSVKRPVNLKSIPEYSCHPTFSLKDNLPTGFDTSNPSYTVACTANTPKNCTSGNDEKSETHGGGLPVGSFKRNDVMIRVVGIAGLLLIGNTGSSGL